MPYTEAVICETFRLSSLAPLGLMHRTLKTLDTNVQGFKISKGTTVICNLYSVHHNPEYWDDPKIFRPEKFLSPTTREKLRNPPHFLPFQVGRRQCLGENFALDSLFLFVTAIFQKFHVTQYSNECPIELESIPGFFRNPKPFYVNIKSRV